MIRRGRKPVLRSLALMGAVAAVLVGGVGVPAAAAAEELPAQYVRTAPTTPATLAPGDKPADGLYVFEVPNQPGTVYAKSTGCDAGEGGALTRAAYNPDLFRQKWRLIQQPDGRFVIVSQCQPAVMWKVNGMGGTFSYGSNGQVGALGDWNPSYDYRQPHNPEHEFLFGETDVPGVYSVFNVLHGFWLSGNVRLIRVS